MSCGRKSCVWYEKDGCWRGGDCEQNGHRHYIHGHYTSGGKRIPQNYIADDCPRLIIDTRLRSWKCAARYRPRRNQIAIKPQANYSYEKFMENYIHELTHWATWLGLPRAERADLSSKYGRVARDHSPHFMPWESRLVEKIAIYGANIWVEHYKRNGWKER